MSFKSVPDHFFDRAAKHPAATGYAVRSSEGWEGTPWSQFADQVVRVARALIGVGIKKGDRIAIMGFNRPAYTMVDMGAMSVGGVPTGIYLNCAGPQMQYILHHAEARLLVIDSVEAWERVQANRDALPHLLQVVMMPGDQSVDDPLVLNWENFLEKGAAVSVDDVHTRRKELQPDDLGCLIYTSGTTGPPKGSMLSHGNLTVATKMGGELVPGIGQGHRLLSYLPMAHAAERALSVLGPAMYGYAVYYAESIERMPQNMREVQPHVFLGVPRVWEKMVAGMTAKLGEVKGPKAALVAWARRTALEANEAEATGRPVSGGLRVKHQLAKRLVLDKVRKAIGLGAGKVFLSGAAPLDAENIRFLASLDLPIREVYGQTENCGPTSNNRPGETRWGTVGRPFQGCEVHIAEDSEILVRGGHVFQGYFKDPEATAAVLKDGWLHTGDLGSLDDGFLSITGRKKEIIITAGGKNITPRNLEEAIKRHPLVEEAVVVGDRKKYLTALLTLDRQAVERFVHELGAAATEAASEAFHRLESVIDDVWNHVKEINVDFARVERIKKIGILPKSLTVEDGELTPTLKLRRSVIHERHADAIDALYADEPSVGEPVVGIGPR